jgi:hypothetical protein
MNPKVVYRYDGYDHLVVTEYPILRETPQGYWIKDDCNYPKEERFIRKDSRKSFAYIDIDDALYSYKMRKKKQIAILKSQLKNAETGLYHANKGWVDKGARWESIVKRDKFLESFKSAKAKEDSK